jgi:hypothetical protein
LRADVGGVNNAVVSWPADWSADVVDRYAALSARFGWPDSVVEAVASNAQYIRRLADSDRPRRHFAGELDGDQWFFEVVEDRGELIVIRQVLIEANGRAHHYSWMRLEDETGGLTDQALDPSQGPSPTTAAAFDEVWSSD